MWPAYSSGLNIKIVVPNGVALPDLWEFISITGVSSCEKVLDYLIPVVRVRTSDDTQRIH